MIYSFDSRVRYSEVGEDRKLSIPAMIDYFQDCSTFHSEDLGVGLEFVEGMKRAWIITHWHIEFSRRPSLGEKIRINTCPYEMMNFMGKRNFWMEDEQGELLAKADSLWVYMDTVRKRPAKVEEEITAKYGSGEPLPMEEVSRKVRIPDGGRKEEPFRVVQSHLDTNHHVNNVQYIFMAQQYLPKDAFVKRLRVEYRNSALLGDVIVPVVCENEDLITVALCDEQDKVYAVLEFRIEGK